MGQSEDSNFGESNPTNSPVVDESLSLEDRLQKRLNWLADAGDWGATEYLKNGHLRDTTPLSTEEHKQAEFLIDIVDAQPKQCWRNAQMATQTIPESCTYVEGHVPFDEFSISIEHAWVEINDRVAELTFEEAPSVPENTVYFGVEYAVDEIWAMQEAFDCCSAIAKLKERQRRYGSD